MGYEDCEVNYVWSLCSLVGAFLDLAIAYFLLCASSVVFLGTKFLALFGLHLPCPCNGLFGTPPNRSLCLKRLLVDFPNEKVSNVQLSVKGKLPFNDQKNCHVNLRLIREQNTNYTHGGLVEIGGEEEEEASGSSKSCSVPRIEFQPKSEIGVVREERPVPVVKGKGVMNYKSRGWIRRRRKRASAVDHWTSSSVSSYDPQFVDFQSGPASPPSINTERVEIRPRNEEDSKEHYGNGVEAHCSDGHRHRHRQPPIGTAFGQRDSFELNEFPSDDDQTEKNLSSYEELRAHAQMEQHLSTDDKNAIQLLELALEEEQASRAALYLELEKERNAAATAADEAMAMILRLQEEKASIEMEARQYQRIIEEKSAYDAEEMNILKEILVRRETEKHFLEKEVETYRQMISLGNGQSAVGDEHILDAERQLFNSSLDESEDPVLMLHQLSASIDKKIMAKSKRSDEFISINKQNPVLPPGMESSMLEWNKDASFLKQGDLATHPCGNQEFQEKEMVTIINGSNISRAQAERERLDTVSQSCKLDVSEHKGEGSKQEENIPDQGMMVVEGLETCGRVDSCIEHDDECLKLHGKDVSQEFHCSSNLSFDKELNVHDVHVIDYGSNVCNEGRRSKVKPLSTNTNLKSSINSNLSSEASAAPMIDVTKDTPSTSRSGAQMEVKRSSIDLSNQLPPLGPKARSVLPCDVRRHSMSTIDIERLKLDYEVERLRERLKTVQEGREKLNLSSVENREGEKFQLKLLEDIANQLREIRQLTDPGKAVRQASLPPPSSKVTTKKKRCRSVSVGIQNSS